VQGADADREDRAAARLLEQAARAASQLQRARRADDAGQDGEGDRRLLPLHEALGHEGGHARIVHGGDAHAQDQAAGEVVGPGALGRGHGEAAGHEQHRDHQRQQGAGRAVARLQAGTVGDHGDEVGGPHARAGHQAGQQQPGGANHALGSAHARVKAERREARGEADQSGDHDQTQVMLRRQAGQNLQHMLVPQGIRPMNTGEDAKKAFR
jgi:hypothetical protein